MVSIFRLCSKQQHLIDALAPSFNVAAFYISTSYAVHLGNFSSTSYFRWHISFPFKSLLFQGKSNIIICPCVLNHSSLLFILSTLQHFSAALTPTPLSTILKSTLMPYIRLSQTRFCKVYYFINSTKCFSPSSQDQRITKMKTCISFALLFLE